MQLIDPILWDRAGWIGVAFGSVPPRDMPFMALLFNDRDAGNRIFEGWRAAIGGAVDRFEILHVSVIEGAIPGEEPGYTVHVGVNDDGLNGAIAAGVVKPLADVFLISRLHRMLSPNSPYLARFREDFQEHGEYLFLPASYDASGQPRLEPPLAIRKRAVTFKHVSQITTDDIDSVVFARDINEPLH